MKKYKSYHRQRLSISLPALAVLVHFHLTKLILQINQSQFVQLYFLAPIEDQVTRDHYVYFDGKSVFQKVLYQQAQWL